MAQETIGGPLVDILNDFLGNGIVQSNENIELCCPDCSVFLNNERFGVYVLASVETYLKYAEGTGCTTPVPVPAMSGTTEQPLGFTEAEEIAINNAACNCCMHIFASVETELKLLEAIGGPPYNQEEFCSENFISCLNELLSGITSDDYSRIIDKGIVEYNSFFNSSQICLINQFINTMTTLDPATSKIDLIDTILDYGIIVSCYDDEIVIASVETWLKWAEGSGLY
jgi:hypothetical protein